MVMRDKYVTVVMSDNWRRSNLSLSPLSLPCPSLVLVQLSRYASKKRRKARVDIPLFTPSPDDSMSKIEFLHREREHRDVGRELATD